MAWMLEIDDEDGEEQLPLLDELDIGALAAWQAALAAGTSGAQPPTAVLQT
jgi:hypothetical protein